MADIFISYSRRDSEQALSLAERLRAAGASVWIDTAALTAAETWSAEIVNAINTCKTFIILLSPESVASHNVTKELSLASEKRKTIVPIVLTECTPNEAMEYALAGLQQVSLADEEALERAFAKLGISGSGFSQVVTPRTTSQKRNRLFVPFALAGILLVVIGAYFFFFSSDRTSLQSGLKTIAVLPFESLSADKENEFFADGMTATLIDMLVPIPELRVVDRKTSMEFKASKLEMKSIATAIGARYLVDGSIQRQGNTLKINVQMTDVETGKVLFSKPFDGQTTDFLKLQEQIAKHIVVELQLAFNPEGIPMPPDAITSNPEAYNLCMKADFAEEHNEMDSCISFYVQATKLDTLYAFPYLSIARVYGNMYLSKDRPDSLLSCADSFFVIGKRLDTAETYSHFVASWLATVHKDFDRAIKEATVYREKRPEDFRAYRLLGLAYAQSGRYSIAADNFIEDLKRNPMGKDDMGMLLFSLWSARDTVRLRQHATHAIQLFNSYITRHPDAAGVGNNSLPLALVFAGRGDEACKRMEQLIKTPGVDSQYFLNTAAISALSGKLERAMEIMRQEVQRLGVQNVDFERGFFDNIRHFPEFKAWEKQKEALSKKHG